MWLEILLSVRVSTNSDLVYAIFERQADVIYGLFDMAPGEF